MPPKLFIGSSREARDAGLLTGLSDELNKGLNMPVPSIELVPWDHSPWQNLDVAAKTLVRNLVDYSYGVFILSADDELAHRGTHYYAARDNIIFEFGLFLAYLGPERTFLVGPTDMANTIPVSEVKTAAAHTTPPIPLPLQILTDLKGAYLMGQYEISSPGVSPTIKFKLDEVVKHIKAVEAKTTGLPPAGASIELKARFLDAQAAIGQPAMSDSYYSGQFFSRFRDIATLKAQVTSKTVQDAVLDLLLYLDRIPDLCDIAQLAREQSHTTGVKKVWIFSDNPLEFRSSTPPDASFRDLRHTITENLKNGVEYVYFVGPQFNHSDINNLVDLGDPDRKAMLKQIQVVKVHAQFFNTYFTLHFEKGTRPKAIYMSSVMRDRKDLLIQVSDEDHVGRIYDRIKVLGGWLENDSPRITRYVL